MLSSYLHFLKNNCLNLDSLDNWLCQLIFCVEENNDWFRIIERFWCFMLSSVTFFKISVQDVGNKLRIACSRIPWTGCHLWTLKQYYLAVVLWRLDQWLFAKGSQKGGWYFKEDIFSRVLFRLNCVFVCLRCSL